RAQNARSNLPNSPNSTDVNYVVVRILLIYPSVLYFFTCLTRPLTSTLFPYTTLFRSKFLAGSSALIRHSIAAPLCFTSFCLNERDRKSTRLNSSHRTISYAVFCLIKKT